MPPELEHVTECVALDEHTTQFHVKVYIPRKDSTTNPKAESEPIVALFNPTTFQKAFTLVDEKIVVESVVVDGIVVHGEITERMPPVDGEEKTITHAIAPTDMSAPSAQ